MHGMRTGDKVILMIFTIAALAIVAYIVFNVLVISDPPEAFNEPRDLTVTAISNSNATVESFRQETQIASTLTP